jgi:transposase
MDPTFGLMRGEAPKQSSMLCLMSPEQLVPADHPLRSLKKLADAALAKLSPTFDRMYSGVGRPSVPPERLLKSMLLIALYSVRSERQFCEQLQYNMLFRWFLDMDMVEGVFDASTFSQNRDRLLEHDVAGEFLRQVVAQARAAHLMSRDHFTVDGSMIEAWASLKSFKRKDAKDDDQPPPDDPGNPTVNFHGERRSNETHASTTDAEAKLARKGNQREAKLSFMAHALMENRNGLIVDFRVSEANGRAEREEALRMVGQTLIGERRITLGADKGYDTREFVAECRAMKVTPHVAKNEHARRRSAIDDRTTTHAGYAVSQRLRKRVEEIFGWMKTVGGFRKTRYRGTLRTQLFGHMLAASYNLLRMSRLLPAGAG